LRALASRFQGFDEYWLFLEERKSRLLSKSLRWREANRYFQNVSLNLISLTPWVPEKCDVVAVRLIWRRDHECDFPKKSNACSDP
ncbi:MAG TPA: hypothetical protein DCP92_05570, partial [Nitrospiraceae bacterium]|nr:hypothetical protein [Nitrospiraceae bacterium]